MEERKMIKLEQIYCEISRSIGVEMSHIYGLGLAQGLWSAYKAISYFKNDNLTCDELLEIIDKLALAENLDLQIHDYYRQLKNEKKPIDETYL